MCADNEKAGGLPTATGNGSALEQVVIALFGVITSGTLRDVAVGAGVQGFAGGEESEAQLEIEHAEAVAGSDNLGEGIPMDGFNGRVARAEALVHI